MASFSVVSNIASVNAQSNLVGTNNGLNKALNRLSSGFRINYAGDDAAGLAVANSYRSDVAVLNQGIRNANDGLSDLQIKDGALNNISNLLDRLSTLATQSASSSSSVSRTTLQAEFGKVMEEINREANVAGLATGTTNFSVFISNAGVDGAVSGDFGKADIGGLGLSLTTTQIDTAAHAAAAVGAIKTAVGSLGTVQGAVGTLENRLQFAVSLAQSQVVNYKAAESRIRDANIAEESANMTRYNILSQSGIASLSQANQTSSSVLALLR